jgi:hypothetical protein
MSFSCLKNPPDSKQQVNTPLKEFTRIIDVIFKTILPASDEEDSDDESAIQQESINKTKLCKYFAKLNEFHTKINDEEMEQIYNAFIKSNLSEYGDYSLDYKSIREFRDQNQSFFDSLHKEKSTSESAKSGISLFKNFLTHILMNDDVNDYSDSSSDDEDDPAPTPPNDQKQDKPDTQFITDFTADYLKYPTINPQELLTPGKVLTLGDMHGNALKFLYLLIRHGVLNISKDDYAELIKIYNTPTPKFSPDFNNTKSKSYFELRDAVQTYQDNINKFNSILNAAAEKMDPTKIGRLRLLGDLISDRGQNDYFTLRIIQCLTKKKPGVIHEIILSNHDYAAFLAVHNLLNPDKPATQWFSDEHYSFKRSFCNLIELTKFKIINAHWIENTLHTIFKPLLKVISYSQEDHQNAKNHLAIYTHAPTKFIEHLQEAAKSLLNIDVDHQNITVSTLINTIDAVNKSVFEKSTLTDEKVRATLTPFIDHRLNRFDHCHTDELAKSFPPKISGYDINYTSGHDLPTAVTQYLFKPTISISPPSLKKLLCFADSLKHTCSLDNYFGKDPNVTKGIYFTKLTSEPAQLQLLLFIKSQLPELKDAVKSSTFYNRFLTVISSYEKSNNYKQLKSDWELTTRSVISDLKKESERNSPHLSLSLLASEVTPEVLWITKVTDTISQKINIMSTEIDTDTPRLKLSTS